MRAEGVGSKLRALARQEVPEGVDLWPAIAARVEMQAARSPQRHQAAALEAARLQRGRPADPATHTGDRRRRLPLRAAAVVAIVALFLGVSLAAPRVVMGVLERVLLVIPGRGVGFVDGPGSAARPWSGIMDSPSLVAAQVVSVRQGDTTFTVTVLASDSRQTVVEYTASGLPQTEEPGQCSSPGGNPRPPFIRDGEGREYAAQEIYGDVCIRADGLYRGGARFPSLPAQLRSIEVVVPVAHVVPPSALPGADTMEWVARVPLVPPDEAGLSAAVPQDAASTKAGITLRVVASQSGPAGTVVMLEGLAGEGAEVRLGATSGNPADGVRLLDDQGREYRPAGAGGALPTSLRFPPLHGGAERVTLVVDSLRVVERATATVTVPLAGRQPGDAFALEPIDLAGQEVRFASTRLAEEGGRLWLHTEVDLGPRTGERVLVSFGIVGQGGETDYGSMQTSGRDGGRWVQLSQRIVPGAEQVRIGLTDPTFIVEGPWEITFPVVQPPS